jgi:hypothetical protein
MKTPENLVSLSKPGTSREFETEVPYFSRMGL